MQPPVHVHQTGRIKQPGHPGALFGEEARVLLVTLPVLQIDLLVRDVHVATQDELALFLDLAKVRMEQGQEAELRQLAFLAR